MRGDLPQVVQRGDHREEDPDEQGRHLDDRRPGELVESEPYVTAAQRIGRRSGRAEHEFSPWDEGRPGCVTGLQRVQIERRDEGDGDDDRGEEHEVHGAPDAHRGRAGGGGVRGDWVAGVRPRVERVVGGQE